MASQLRACTHCGLIQQVPMPAPVTGETLACARCGGRLGRRASAHTTAWAGAAALAALILYPASMLLPVMSLERLGHHHSTTIWSGVVEMIRDGDLAIGLVIFTCSVLAPVLKILGMFLLCARPSWMSSSHRASVYRWIDWIGRWGMIDVLLVAILVAAVKLGNWVQVEAGAGVLVFGAVVVLSLLSWVLFDPADIWEEEK